VETQEPQQQTQQYDTVCLVFHEAIDQASVRNVMDACARLVREYGVKTIYFQISSGGGSVDSAITLYNFLKSLPCEIVMHNTGSIDSAANVVFMAGDKRYAAAHTSFLFHGVTWSFSGNYNHSQIKEYLSNVDSAEKKIAGIVTGHTSLSQAEITELFREGESMSASAAKDKGIVSSLKDVELAENVPVVVVQTKTEA
jgi:ATP-dependent Clp protease protease subunit